MTKIKVIKKYQVYKKGKEYFVTPNIAHGLIEQGVAELSGAIEVKPKPKSKKTKEMKPSKSKFYKTK